MKLLNPGELLKMLSTLFNFKIPVLVSKLLGFFIISAIYFEQINTSRTYDEARLSKLRDEVKSMFYHAYDSYIFHAYPYDELRPLSCDGVDTWGSYSLTLIDSLDTLAVMGNYSEFRRVAQLIINNAHFDLNINVSVFETNIRIIGGLLSAHLLSQKAGMELWPGYPCNGPLLRLAEKVARKLLPAFDTNTGMPYGTVNLRFGVPPNETPVTCTAGVGTFIVEFGTLSRLTGDPLYEKVALRALHSLYSRRSSLDLVGNHIDTETGRWTAIDSGIGAGVDSYFEYLVKGAILLQRPELAHMFHVSYEAIEKHLAKGGWYVWATMTHGHVSSTTFQSLEAYWPGLLSLLGEFKPALKAITNYHRIWKQYGGLPELYNILQGKASHQREGYPLRPELVESAMYLYRATSDPYLLEIGEDILHSIIHSSRTECGFATIRDVTSLTLEDRMESFFLSETAKYLYLLFDPTNFIHGDGEEAVSIDHPLGQCTLYAGGYIFNTEAHPIDPSALACCSGPTHKDLHDEITLIDEFMLGEKIQSKKTGKKSRKDGKKKVPIVTKVIAGSEPEFLKGHSLPKLLPPPNTNPLLKFNKSPGVCEKPEKKEIKPYMDYTKSDYDYMLNKEDSILEKLLNKLFEEEKNRAEGSKIPGIGEARTMKESDIIRSSVGLNAQLESLSKNSKGVARKLEKPEFIESKKIELLVEKFEMKNEKVEVMEKPVEIGRVRWQNREVPDFDLIFGSGRSLSFSFALKWLRSFPDLIKQLIPSERFDIQNFYSRMNEEFSQENFSKIFNLSLEWTKDFKVLKCQSPSLADRFLFLRSTIEE